MKTGNDICLWIIYVERACKKSSGIWNHIALFRVGNPQGIAQFFAQCHSEPTSYKKNTKYFVSNFLEPFFPLWMKRQLCDQSAISLAGSDFFMGGKTGAANSVCVEPGVHLEVWAYLAFSQSQWHIWRWVHSFSLSLREFALYNETWNRLFDDKWQFHLFIMPVTVECFFYRFRRTAAPVVQVVFGG